MSVVLIFKYGVKFSGLSEKDYTSTSISIIHKKSLHSFPFDRKKKTRSERINKIFNQKTLSQPSNFSGST